MDLLTTFSHHLMAVMLGTWGTAIHHQPSTMFKLAPGRAGGAIFWVLVNFLITGDFREKQCYDQFILKQQHF
jgi:hypothetical protein